MKLIITIDTEEDNWGGYDHAQYSTSNIGMIPVLQGLFDDFNVRPTYLISYPVATDRKAAELFGRLLSEKRCEVGSHCHPWNTPPFEEERNERNSMICNLPPALQYRKLEALHKIISENTGVEPVSFRAGRWAFSNDVSKSLLRLGYRVDTSVTPFVDWSESYGPNFSDQFPKPYRFSTDDIRKETPEGQMLEIPATIGFLQQNFRKINSIHKMLRERKITSKMKVNGILFRLNVINKIWLSPELSGSKEMIELTRRMRANGYRILNMSFHSPSLKSGLTPFTRTPEDEKEFLNRIREYLRFARNEGIESITLSESEKFI